MYMNGAHQNTCKIHAEYMQDTSGYVLYRNPPPICIGNPRLAVTRVYRSCIDDLVISSARTAATPTTAGSRPHDLAASWFSNDLQVLWLHEHMCAQGMCNHALLTVDAPVAARCSTEFCSKSMVSSSNAWNVQRTGLVIWSALFQHILYRNTKIFSRDWSGLTTFLGIHR